MASKFLRYAYLLTKYPENGATDGVSLSSGWNGLSYVRYHHFMTQIRGELTKVGPDPAKGGLQRRCMASSIGVPNTAPIVTVSKIKRFLKENSIGFEEGYTCLKIPCPVCHPKCQGSNVPSGTYSGTEMAFINVITGLFTCYSCQVVTNWQTLQDYLSVEGPTKSRESLASESSVFLTPHEAAELQNHYTSSTPLVDVERPEFEQLVRRFGLQKIEPLTMKLMDVRLAKDRSKVLFPVHGPARNLVALRSLSATQGRLDATVFPRPNLVGLFGWQKIKKHHQELVLTGSEGDALAVFQETNLPVLSLMSGTSHLPLEVLPLFEQFHKITIWFGNKLHDWESVKMFSRKLGEKRCHYIRPKDGYPLATLQTSSKTSLLSIVKAAQPVSHKAITTFHSLRAGVADMLHNVEASAGVRWTRFPGLVRLLKGFRRGELTVFTGPTGSGKTTFMCEYSLDLCMQGVNTLWGSFEIQNERLAKIMLTQFSLISLEKHLDEFDSWADKFELLPLYFMTFHGEQSFRNVLDAMSHAVYVHDIQHVVVDNVQFMMGVGEESSRVDRFWKQDLLVGAFRRFATQHNCHVTLVMHPRKERDSEELSNHSIFGGAKASQEADNVLILQDGRLNTPRGRKHLQVTKNRFDGDIGVMPLEFNKENLTFSGKKQLKSQDRKQGSASSSAEQTPRHT
ncbi:unnamed protein product [Ixodes hexagonus]